MTEEKPSPKATLFLAQLASMIEHMPDATVLIDQEGTIRMANQQLERMFFYNHNELLAQSVDTLVPVRLRGKHQSHRVSFFVAPKRRAMGRELDLFGLRKDGVEFPVDISLNPITTELGPMVLAAVRDMTETIQLQEKERIVDKIIAKAAAVTMSMAELTDATNKVMGIQTSQIRQIRRVNFWLTGVIFVQFLLLMGGFYQTRQIQKNSDEIVHVQQTGTVRGEQTAKEQQARREKVFCPLFAVMLDLYDPVSPYAKENQTRYEKTFDTLEQSAAYLGCATQPRANRVNRVKP